MGPPAHLPRRFAVVLSLVTLGVLCVVSLLVGVGDLSDEGLGLLAASRLPRTLALVLAGTGMAVAGVIMQVIAQNRFVEPTTAGTVEAAALGMLLVTVLVPEASVITKMLVASAAGVAGSVLFLRILRLMPLRSSLTVPLVGIVLSGIIGAAATFVAFRYDLLQALTTWRSGDFSAVVRGRYELLWAAVILNGVAYLAARWFTIAGLGQETSVSLGLDYRLAVALALTIASMMTAVTVATVGMIPFVGLVAPNIVARVVGDNLRRSLPTVAAAGAALLLACDILGRLVRYPYEIPVGIVMGVVGSGMFLLILLRQDARRA